ncbi:MAG: hypothetical protein K6D38_00245 [Pseudobutyrivibrio sp.]|nr:hypothetical protein [Pseudobutyrivibrio sp.]
MLKVAEKVDEVLYVNINYKSGLYSFDNPKSFPDIPEEIMVNVPFYYSENSFEELVETIGDEDDKYIYMPHHPGNLKLIESLAKVLMDEYQKTVFIQDEEAEPKGFIQEGAGIVVIKHGDQLRVLDEIEEADLETIFDDLYESRIEIDYEYKNAMKNGFVAFMTGTYPGGIDNTLAKHVLLNDKCPDDINQYVDMNGAVICPNENKTTKETIQHVHTIYEDCVMIDSDNIDLKHRICSYKDFVYLKRNNQLKEDITYYLKIENQEDLTAFSSDLDEYIKTGLVDIYDKKIVDSCRWTSNCGLKKLLRFRIENEEIYPCLTSNVSIGSVKMEPEKRIIEANRLYDRALSETGRNANCACLPEGITKEDYIDFMEKYPMVSDYIFQNQLTCYIKKNGKTCKDVSSVRFSTGDRRLVYPRSKASKKSINVFNINGNYYYFDIRTGKLLKLESKYVFLMEAHANGETENAIVEEMANYLSVENVVAKEVVNQGMKTLKAGGMIE